MKIQNNASFHCRALSDPRYTHVRVVNAHRSNAVENAKARYSYKSTFHAQYTGRRHYNENRAEDPHVGSINMLCT